MRSRSRRVLAFASLIMMVAVFPPVLVLGQEGFDLWFDTDQPFYLSGETAHFTGEGFLEGTAYNVTIYHGAGWAANVSFTAGPAGSMPEDVSITAYETGTYTATLINATVGPSFGGTVAEIHFGVWGTDRPSYGAGETIVVSGGGVEPGATVQVEIRNNSELIATLSPTADGLGEFSASYTLPSNLTTADYSVHVSFPATFDEGVLDTPLSYEASFEVVSMEDQIRGGFEEVVSGIEELVEHGGIRRSLTAKIDAASRLFEMAMSRSNGNLVKAAENVLRAFINHVKAQNGTQPGKHLNSTVSEELIAKARSLIERLEQAKTSLSSTPAGKRRQQMMDQLIKKELGSEGDEAETGMKEGSSGGSSRGGPKNRSKSEGSDKKGSGPGQKNPNGWSKRKISARRR